MFHKLRLILILSLVTIGSSPAAWASWSGEMKFLSGYHSYLFGNYGGCADQFYEALELGIPNESKARLYLSYCQLRLKSKAFALYNYLKISQSDLSKNDHRIYKTIENQLRSEIKAATQWNYWLSPYVGTLSYGGLTTSTSSSGASGMFYGLYADLANLDWTISLGGQLQSFTSFGTASTQMQGLLGVEKRLSSSFSFRTKAIYVSPGTTTSSLAFVGNTGFTWSLSPAFHFKLDFFFSYYPSVSFGPLSLYQFSPSILVYLLQNSDSFISLELGSESILSRASGTGDTTSSFTLRNFYERASLDLAAKFGFFELDAGGWLGTEAFGVRKGGATIYAALEEHRSGWYGGLKFHVNPSFSLQGAFMYESVNTYNINAFTNTYYGGILLNL